MIPKQYFRAITDRLSARRKDIYLNKVDKMKQLNFKDANLTVDWISFNIQGSVDPKAIAYGLTKYFTPHVLIDDVPSIGFHGFKKKYKVSIRQYTRSKGYWIGTRIIFSGKNAAYLYKLIKTQKFDWSILKFNQQPLSLGRIDLCFFRTNYSSETTKSFEYSPHKVRRFSLSKTLKSQPKEQLASLSGLPKRPGSAF